MTTPIIEIYREKKRTEWQAAEKVANPQVIFLETTQTFHFDLEDYFDDCRVYGIDPAARLPFVCTPISPVAPNLVEMITDKMDEWNTDDNEMELPDLSDIQELLNKRFEENAESMQMWTVDYTKALDVSGFTQTIEHS